MAQGICIGIKFPGGTEAADSETTLGRDEISLRKVSISHEFLRLHGSVE